MKLWYVHIDPSQKFSGQYIQNQWLQKQSVSIGDSVLLFESILDPLEWKISILEFKPRLFQILWLFQGRCENIRIEFKIVYNLNRFLILMLILQFFQLSWLSKSDFKHLGWARMFQGGHWFTKQWLYISWLNWSPLPSSFSSKFSNECDLPPGRHNRRFGLANPPNVNESPSKVVKICNFARKLQKIYVTAI